MDIEIVDIYWERIYLNIIFQGKNIEEYGVFLNSATQSIKLELNNIGEDRYKSVINITNITDVLMLKNENYKFIIKGKDITQEISISKELGYKLETLDKIYRYSNQNLAYTINFMPKEHNSKITCILVSRYMLINEKY